VATDTAHRHVHWRIEQAIGESVATVTDVTGGLAQINVQGPRSRELLQSITDHDLSELAYRQVREIAIGFARVQCARITYVGELGYELFVPVEQAVHVYDHIVAAGEPFGLRHVGLQALGSLRQEKAYRDYGHDIDNTDTPVAAGFTWAMALDKGDFRGRAAVERQLAAGTPHQRLLQVLVLDPTAMMFHAEVVHRNGVAVGYLRSASYGHTLGGAVGLAMLDTGDSNVALTQAWIDSGTFTVEIADQHYPAAVSLRPLYDPRNERLHL
jgi:4-methylaminobutanoate oxidase (formaldehyde-forming)